MFTPFRPYYLIFVVAAQVLHFFTNATGQDIDLKVEIHAEKPSVVSVTGRFPNAKADFQHRNLSFLRSYAGFDQLGERIAGLALKNKNGEPVAYQTAVPGEYVTDAPFVEWSYTLDLSYRKEQNAAAHISWIGSENGILMLGDMLPLFGDSGKPVSARARIVLPNGWRQMDNRIDDTLITEDVASEIVAIGKDLRFRTVHAGGTAIMICIAGEWLFTSDEITSFARDVYSKTRETFGSNASEKVFVNIFRFPQNAAHGQWQAETRGRNVTIISSDMPFKTQSLQRLHEQLRHEMFHLWIPNGVNLSGNYDWFYEGFALYASLKTAVAMNQIRFGDFLDTISRARAIDARQTNRLSLIEASATRWSGADTYVYARGMVTAFLCDILLLHSSKGKRSLNDVFRELHAKHKYPNARMDGNAAVLEILKKNSELEQIVAKYVKGSGKFEWRSEINFAGLEAKNGLAVLPKLTGRQKDLLDRLGYNNWRRLTLR